MDIDVLRVSGKNQWKRLDELTRARVLSGEDIDELDRLYRSATTDLARVRTVSPDPDVIAELSRILSAARGRLAGTGGLTGAVIAYDPQVEGPLAERTAFRGHFDHEWDEKHDRGDQADHEHAHERGRVVRPGTRGADENEERHPQIRGAVDDCGGEAFGGRGRGDVEGDGLARADIVVLNDA